MVDVRSTYLWPMEAKFFQYRVEGLELQTLNENLKISNSFNKKEMLDKVKSIFKEQGFKIDLTTLDYKITDDYIIITGMAVAEEAPKNIGFMSGR